MKNFILFLVLLVSATPCFAQSQRRTISIVGSSTMYPFAALVGEYFTRTTGNLSPHIESTGSGSGFKRFCAGSGLQYPDITNASRLMTSEERATCLANGVTEIVKMKIGRDGIVLATSRTRPKLNLTLQDIYLALAMQVPDPENRQRLIANPYSRWQQINSALPNITIHVYGPPPTSGTRDAFDSLVMERGAMTFPLLRKMKKENPAEFKQVANRMREDGRWVNAGENDSFIVQKLKTNPDACGIFGFSFLKQNEENLQAASLNGFSPDPANIADGKYPVSRSLFLYVKKQNSSMVSGLPAYLKEFTSQRASGKRGYLAHRGMIPLSAREQQINRERVTSMQKK
ncbi:substrate-binding domain-containing protein [Desulforhopalus vacuolatus]|uniref:substrate-binding domain-containing protein n=1 Tax=Desulforhopalus vacuolatus TaxID=40414 RepID=UPI0019626A0A|nr:substrate-binding domain-containing protein [Desulforhopalus vacuolatus]MBM9518779.1 substrate-binding domain-containing protein [Desulforhopalus vacuolatus]